MRNGACQFVKGEWTESKLLNIGKLTCSVIMAPQEIDEARTELRTKGVDVD